MDGHKLNQETPTGPRNRRPQPANLDGDVAGGALVGGILGAAFGLIGVLAGGLFGALIGKNVSDQKKKRGGRP